MTSSHVKYDSYTDLFDAHQAKVQPMLHVTIALHKGLNGPLTGTGAMEAPGAGASMTLEVDFQTPGQEGTHHMSMPIGELSAFSLVCCNCDAQVINCYADAGAQPAVGSDAIALGPNVRV